MEVKLRVQRFDPAGEGRPYAQGYTLQVESATTILDALLKVADEQDPTLAFRRMCRSGICGACGMNVNGKPLLACQAQVGEIASGDGLLDVGPMPNFRVLRDLVVDLDPFFEGLVKAIPWLIPSDKYDGRIAPEITGAMEEPATCILCGLCEADQPREADQAAGPASWVKAYRFSLDPRDALGKTRLQMLADLGLISQVAVNRLAQACPKNIFLKEALVVADGDEGRLPGGE